MKSNLLKLSIAAAAFAFSISSSNAQTIDGSTAYMGFSQFLVSQTGNNNSNLAESTPEANGGGFLSGLVGVGASGNGYGGFGKFANSITGLNDSNFGSVVGGPDLTGKGGNSAIKFKTGDNRYRLDFMIKNDSQTADFILDSIHFDSRVPDETANNAFVIQYLANNGNSNLQNMGTNANVSNLAFIAGSSLTVGQSAAVGISEHDVSIAAQLAGGGTGVKLAAGDQASFRISWIGSSNVNKQNQMDNLAISGVFASAAVPEPSSYALLAGLFACTYMMVRRRAVS
tara:strand:+ start:606 stop:1460 length:855 start_codon:yes stop_codon:yes gene_type:complete